MAVFAVAMMSMAALAADPGTTLPQSSEASDQKAGSLLVYTHYQSSATNIAARDTKINITNTNDSNPIIVHFFFVSGCSVADFKTELTANQTYSLLTSDVDPDSSGYIIAIAENFIGVPIHFNFLIGDLYTKDARSASASYQANLGAIAFAAEWPIGSNPRTVDVSSGSRLEGSMIPSWTVGNTTNTTVTARFSGSTDTTVLSDGFAATTAAQTGYNRLPSVLALSNIPSRAYNDRTLVTVIAPTGNLLTGPGAPGTVFGLLFDDAEQSQSFQMTFTCSSTLTELSNTTPRTVPRFDSVIPAGRTGWMKFWAGATVGILGSQIVYNQQARFNFEGGHNLHHLMLANPTTNATGTARVHNNVVVPVFPFSGN